MKEAPFSWFYHLFIYFIALSSNMITLTGVSACELKGAHSEPCQVGS